MADMSDPAVREVYELKGMIEPRTQGDTQPEIESNGCVHCERGRIPFSALGPRTFSCPHCNQEGVAAEQEWARRRARGLLLEGKDE